MSESPVYVPPFVRASRDLGVPLRAARRADDEFDDDFDADGEVDVESGADGDTDGARASGDAPAHARGERRALPVASESVREGLPPSYRMRHEPHYVDALVARSVPTAPVVPAAAVEPPLVTVAVESAPAVDALQAPEALADAAAALADAFDAIQAALRDLPTRGRSLRDRVAVELARAEATRGRWLADATVVMQHEPTPALDEVDLVRVLRVVIEAHGPESRLSGGEAALPVPPGTCPVFGDERLLTTAVGASLAAMRAVIENRGDARKMVMALAPRHDPATRTLEIAQTAVRVPVSAYVRFFDASWKNHPAGPTGALMLAAARRIAVAHGGALEIEAIDGGGCRLRLSVPAAD